MGLSAIVLNVVCHFIANHSKSNNMRKFIVLSGLFIFCLGSICIGQNLSFNASDSFAVKKIIQDWEINWNKHDAKAFASVFLSNGEFTNVVGQSAKGRKQIEDFHTPMFKGESGYPSFKSSTIKIDAPRISVVKPDVASVDFIWHLDKVMLPDGTEVKNRRGLVTWLMVKENGKWGVAIMHNAELPSENK